MNKQVVRTEETNSTGNRGQKSLRMSKIKVLKNTNSMLKTTGGIIKPINTVYVPDSIKTFAG